MLEGASIGANNLSVGALSMTHERMSHLSLQKQHVFWGGEQQETIRLEETEYFCGVRDRAKQSARKGSDSLENCHQMRTLAWSLTHHETPKKYVEEIDVARWLRGGGGGERAPKTARRSPTHIFSSPWTKATSGKKKFGSSVQRSCDSHVTSCNSYVTLHDLCNVAWSVHGASAEIH